MAQKTTRGFGQWPLRKKLLLILGLLLFALAAAVFVHRVQHQRAVAADKARFAQADKDVQAVASQIVAAIGQPQDQRHGGKCSYAHQEFSKGPLSCDVYSYLVYGADNASKANGITKESINIINKTSVWSFQQTTQLPSNSSGIGSDNFTNLSFSVNKEIKSESYRDTENKFACGLSYIYFLPSVSQMMSYPTFNITSPHVLLIDISCGAQATVPLYSL